MREVVTKVYQYGELSDKAKGKARDWMRQGEAEYFDPDHVIEDFTTIASILGIMIKTRTYHVTNGKTGTEPCIFYNVGGYQGDGACFEGSYRYARLAHTKIREHAPIDVELHRIADILLSVQRQWQYALGAAIVSGRESMSSHAVIEVEDTVRGRDIGDVAGVVAEALRDLMDWLYKQLETEYEYSLSDEVLVEMIEGNEYEFTEDG